MKKRLCIFAMYDADGIADEYIYYLLKQIRNYIDFLVVVCNGELQSESNTKLRALSDQIFIREDVGYDCGAYKDVLINLLGWDTVYKYDELLLLNDSCYGPIFPFESIFQKMDGTADFWGLTAQDKMYNPWDDLEQNMLPYHIQPYFLVVGERMLHSDDFCEFWETLGSTKTYSEAIVNYELRLTAFFNSRGFSSKTYIDNQAFSGTAQSNYVYIIYDSFLLLAEHGSPLIKRKAFQVEPKSAYPYNSAEVSRKTLDYISACTNYDEDLIWQNLIRVTNPVDLRNSLHLNYIFSSQFSSKQLPADKKIALVAHLYYSDLIDFMFTYIANVPNEIDIIISTKGEANVNYIIAKFKMLERENYHIVTPQDRGREVASLLVACKNLILKYDYVGFIKDKKSNSGTKYATVGQSWFELTLENTVKNPDYIYNVINCLEQNPRLGFLSPPAMYASHFFVASTMSWEGCKDAALKLVKRLNLSCRISFDKHPFALGSTFWCRTKALKALFDYDWSYEDFHEEPVPVDGTLSHAIERIYPFVAQHEGYYSGLMFCEEYASLYLVNYQYMLSKFIVNHNLSTGASQFEIPISIVPLIKFCSNYNKVYIYGAGMYGRNCYYSIQKSISNIAGFVVSDGYRQSAQISGKQVYELSEISPDAQIGIIVAMNGLLQQEVLPKLSKRGFTEIYTTTE